MPDDNTALDLWKRFKTTAKDPLQSESPPEVSTIRRMIARLSELEGTISGAHGISTFFQSVGDGMVQAQRDLDGKTRIYNQGDPVQKKMFQVQKATANLKFAISSLSSRGFNVIVASQKEKEERVQEQAVTFDIVCAPSPPDADLRGLAIASFIMTDQTRRQNVIHLVRDRLANSSSQVLRTKLEAFFAGLLERDIVILETEKQWLLLRVETEEDDGEPFVSLLQVVTVQIESGRVTARAGAKPDNKYRPLTELLRRVYEWQRTVLPEPNGGT